MEMGNAEAEKKFKEIGEAYETLSDANKKVEYDYQLESYVNSLNNSGQYNNNEDYENLVLHAQELESQLEYLKKTNNATHNSTDNKQLMN